MMEWLRRLLSGSPAAPGDAGEWAVAAGDEAGHPVIVRTRTRAPQGMTAERYPASVEIVWPFDGGAHGGMPTPELSERMVECENVLGTLEGPTSGLLGITITGHGRREWVWYVADAEAFSGRVRDLLAQYGSRFPVEVRSAGPVP